MCSAFLHCAFSNERSDPGKQNSKGVVGQCVLQSRLRIYGFKERVPSIHETFEGSAKHTRDKKAEEQMRAKLKESYRSVKRS